MWDVIIQPYFHWRSDMDEWLYLYFFDVYNVLSISKSQRWFDWSLFIKGSPCVYERYVHTIVPYPNVWQTNLRPILQMPITNMCTGILETWHYSYAIMSASPASWNVCSGADHRKHQRSVSLAFVKGIHRWSLDSLHKRPVTQKKSIWWRHRDSDCICVVSAYFYM